MKRILIVALLFSLFLSGCTKEEVQEEKLDVKEVSLIENAMTYDDLFVTWNESQIEIGMTVNEVKDKLGIPMSEMDTRKDPNAWKDKGTLYGDEIILDYDGLNLIYFNYSDDVNDFRLSNIISRREDVTGPRGIKIGMTEEDVLKLFPRNSGKKYLCDKGDTEPWGLQIYGDVTGNDFQNVIIKSDVQTAYKLYPYKEDDEYCLVYEYWKLNDEKQINQLSENAAVIVYLQKGIVKSINIEFRPNRVN